MRPPQSKAHRHHESPFDYRKGEHLSMDPVGPVKVPAPRGLDSMMVYGDKSTGHISVQLYKSEAAGGKRKVKDLLAPKEFPCTPELYKRIMLEPVPSTDEEKKVMMPIKSCSILQRVLD
jgi:hypothetical protein